MEVMKVEKAGMDGIDKERIAKIIAENTNAKYESFTKKQQARVEARITQIRQILSNVSPAEMSRSQKEADDMVAKLEATRDLNRHCVHIDMDAFFAAVEMRDIPRLRSIPMAVGSTAMLSTSNYVARKFGVRAAMPGFIALKLCPELEIVPGSYKKYGKESKVFAGIFAEYDDDFSMGSLDEAYIDLTSYLSSRNEPKTFIRKRYGGECICRLPLVTGEEDTDKLAKSSEICEKCGKERITFTDKVEFGYDRAEVVKEIRFRVEQATGLTCSAGIASNFRLAKICSDLNKPNGQYELPNEYVTIMEFLRVLPIRKVCGVGRVSEAHLKACGMETVGDIFEKRALLKFVFSALSQEHFIRVSLGVSGRSRDCDSRRKSISVERTFTPTSKEAELRDYVQSICEELTSDIQRAGITGGRCITLKVKLSSFDVLTRSLTLPVFIKDYEEILLYANNILTKELGQEMRLLGVRLSNLKFADDALAERTLPEFFKAKRQKLDEDDVDEEIIECQESETEESSSGPSSSCAEAEQPTVECPVCKERVPEDDTILNQHIDECLNRDMIKAKPLITKKPKVDQKPASKKKKEVKTPKRPAISITSFFPIVKD